MDIDLKELIEKADFEAIFNNKGYSYFKEGDYNLNIIGIRNLLGDTIQRDKFDDALVLIYKVNGEWVGKMYEITTDPSLKLLKFPANANGTAILVPNQYRSTYKVDLHKGKYQALCQRSKPVEVYRDNNRDNNLDMNPYNIEKGMFGINIHRASDKYISETINGYSAGCQVFKSFKDFNEFMRIVNISKLKYGNSFTYTLLTTNDLV